MPKARRVHCTGKSDAIPGAAAATFPEDLRKYEPRSDSLRFPSGTWNVIATEHRSSLKGIQELSCRQRVTKLSRRGAGNPGDPFREFRAASSPYETFPCLHITPNRSEEHTSELQSL